MVSLISNVVNDSKFGRYFSSFSSCNWMVPLVKCKSQLGSRTNFLPSVKLSLGLSNSTVDLCNNNYGSTLVDHETELKLNLEII